MGVKEDAKGLDPSEVPLHVDVSSTDEVGVDVEVGVGDDAEISVFFSMEVEGDSISSDESWVLAHCSGTVTVCGYVKKRKKQLRIKTYVQTVEIRGSY